MSSFLEQLENNEAILLMYLANELPAADHAEVEEMLRHDAALRAELDDLRGLHDGAVSALGDLDAAMAGRLMTREDLVVRSTSREISRAMVRKQLVPVESQAPIHKTKFQMAWWAYPTAAAAVVIVALTLWSSNGDPANLPGDNIPVQIAAADAVFEIIRESPALDRIEQAEELASNLRGSDLNPLAPSLIDWDQ